MVSAPLPPDFEGDYAVRISRRTVDKLGVKLYDKVSAVVAELVANGYDADAEKVTVRLPLATALATRRKGEVVDRGYVIEVEDDGHGMTPTEAQKYFLDIGRDRREHTGQGATSRDKDRPVMGRKGIGKLAPFGICKRIEVESAGGDETPTGFLVSHFFLDYDAIVEDSNEPLVLEKGGHDRTYAPTSGTTIRLHTFQLKRVPDLETFTRQMAARFAFAQADFELVVEDTRTQEPEKPVTVKHLDVPLLDGTRLDLADYPVRVVHEEDGRPVEEVLPVTGWLGLAKDAYKNEEMAGVRVYARGKIVATTRDFEQPAGYTGEFTVRSYLVGEVHAEWLDEDDGEDLVRSDRQGIIWDSEYGRALRDWGATLLKQIGKTSRAPRRKRVRDLFMAVSDFPKRAADRFADTEVRDVAVEMAKKFGALAAEDELQDEDYVEDLVQIVLAVAPHKALIEALQAFSEAASGESPTMESLLDLFGKARIAELTSYSQVAAERVKTIGKLEEIVYGDGFSEADLQKLIEQSRWLIEPTWSPISEDVSLKTFKKSFEHFWRKQYPDFDQVILGTGLDDYSTKRPDFTLVEVGQVLHIVEIKARGHAFANADFDRLFRYVDAFERFFAANPSIALNFARGWQIELVADGVNITDVQKRKLYQTIVEEKRVVRTSWDEFLDRAKRAHQVFLQVSEEYLRRAPAPAPQATAQSADGTATPLASPN